MQNRVSCMHAHTLAPFFYCIGNGSDGSDNCIRDIVYATERRHVVYATAQDHPECYAAARSYSGLSSNLVAVLILRSDCATEQVNKSGRTLATARSVHD